MLCSALESLRPSVRPSVCLSVCQSHAGIVTKLIKLGSRGLHRRIAPAS